MHDRIANSESMQQDYLRSKRYFELVCRSHLVWRQPTLRGWSIAM